MKKVQNKLDDNFIKSAKLITDKPNFKRSYSQRLTLRNAIDRFIISRLEIKHRNGYRIHPTKKEEFEIWESEQVWGDE